MFHYRFTTMYKGCDICYVTDHIPGRGDGDRKGGQEKEKQAQEKDVNDQARLASLACQ